MMWRALISCLALPGAAMAGGLFEPPLGCETYLTSQNRSCEVEHFYRCPQIAPDHQWRIVYDADGPRYVSRIDHQAQWVSSGPIHDPERRSSLTPLQDAMSLDTLFAEQKDDFEFHQRRLGEPFENIRGEDRITGRTQIDGEPLLTTTYWVQIRDWQGRLIQTDTGQQFVSTIHRRFFGGPSTIELADGALLSNDSTPVDFIYPGEDGFAATLPLYNCGVLSMGPARPAPIPAAFHSDLAPVADAARLRATTERD